jgi:4a-hydroxytetrahydrobiopterin dehydratase
MSLLSPDEIAARLRQLSGWQQADRAIRKQFAFEAFLDGIRFVDRVASLAEAADHHPDVDIRYTRVIMTLSTHSAGGITEKDFALAEQIDKVVKR